MLELARVVRSHPEKNKVDLIFTASGRRAAGVRVMAGVAGGNHGFSDLPEPDVDDPQNPYETGLTGKRDIVALVGYAGRIPIVVGFLHPESSQCLFEDKNRMVYRHASDFYATVDGKGNFILRHPSGTYLGIGDTAELEDLTGKDYNGLWALTANAESSAYIHLAVANSAHGGVTALSIGPTGAINLTSAGAISYTTTGAMTFNASAITLNAPVAAVGASLTHNGVNVGETHLHQNVQTGSANSGPPVGEIGGGGRGGSGFSSGDGATLATFWGTL